MKNVYVIVCINRITKQSSISSECYSDIENAQKFCESRVYTRKVSELMYVSPDYEYWITILDVK